MTDAKYWKLDGNRYGGITARGNRFIVHSLDAARRKIGRTKTHKSANTRKSSKRTTKVAKKNKNRRRNGFLSTQSMFKWLRLGAFIGPAAARAMEAGSTANKLKMILADYSGFHMDHPDTGWQWRRMQRGWMPYIATTIMTHGVQKLTGIIRRL